MIKKLVKNILKLFFTTLVKQRARKIGKDLSVNFYSKVNLNTCLGKNVNLNGLEISGKGPVLIGNNFHSGKNCLFITQNHNFRGTKIPYDKTYDLKEITIGDNVWIGHNVTIIGSCTIGEGVIIQAGSVVIRDIEPLLIVGGNPAKAFSSRDSKHYYDLKEKKEFH